ncbi:unnamed protein product [Brassica napus]|uniref:anthranilate synthase n=2 Tax=Brassica napus TaxID=3708 RepID=A0A816I1Y9_BRANA|nr:unnamed protein product [Brassica napus]
MRFVLHFDSISISISISISLLFYSTMPTIAGPSSSPHKHIVAARSENTGVPEVNTPRKRKLRSDSADEVASTAIVTESSFATPMKWKSPRRCAVSSPKTLKKEDSKGKLDSPVMSAVKDRFDCLDVKSKWNPREDDQMKAVKEALHVSKAPSTVVCREDEQRRVLEFVKGCMEQKKAGSLYICGCPGTGKSLSMEKIRQQAEDWAQQVISLVLCVSSGLGDIHFIHGFFQEGLPCLETVSVNCTSLTKTTDIFSKILGESETGKKVNGPSSPLQRLQVLFSQKQQSSSTKMMLIIADEMDYLITRDRGVLHELFMLTTLPFSRCILIGVANAIDLADRFLPKLKSLNCKPLVVTFRAYSMEQILRILQERLVELPYVAFQSKALELCARKVSAASGDMRKALSVCRSALEILETEVKGSTEQEPQSPVTEDQVVKMDHMVAALSKTFKSPVVDTIQSLPQHQQIIVCSAAKAFRGSKKDRSIAELNKLYTEICKSSMITPAGITEFTNMCTVLNDQGILKLSNARDDKLKRVSLRVDEADITFALKPSLEMSAVSISSVKSNLSAVKAIAVTHHRPPPSFRCPSSLASLSTTTSLHCNDVSSISRSKLLPPSRLHPIKSSPSPTPSLADSSVNQLTKFKEAAEKGNLVPLYRCVFSDHLTPILAYRCLVKEDDRDAPSFLFESVEPGLQASNIGRYSVVGAQPTIEIVAKGNVVTVMDHGAVRRTVEEVDDPMMVPQKIMEEWEPQRIDELPEAFCGGWVGYFSYDTVRFVEKKKLPFSNAPEDDRSLPDVHLGLYDDVIVFDHVEKKAYVIHWVRIDKDRSVEDNYTDGMYQLESLVSRIQDQKPPKMPTGFIKLRTEQFGPKLEKSTMTSEAYKEAVLEAKEHILAGDIFQIVLSQRFERRTFADPFEIYRALRIVNPSPYMAYLQARGCILVASSPEILLRSKNRKITNRPLAGTVRRGKTPKEDLMLEKELLSDEKQCAEHIMLVDLGRNDVGKVSKPGSVEVEKLMNIERYSHVMHISSTVKGELLDDLTSWDALRAALPVGTVSGAPKVKAMELIDKLEVTRRGPYSGGFGGISFNGDMDIALALRTMVFPTNTRYDTLYSYKHSQRRREWIAHIQAGAGVVADSNPEDEQRECENKAAALARAIDLAESSFLETPVVTRPRINNVLE